MDHIPLSVLTVEDDESDFLLTRDLLSGNENPRISVRRAERLEQALAEARQHRPDVVLLDLNLPDSSGWATFTRMRAGVDAAPIILMTGLDDEALASKALNEGAQDYLVKGKFNRDQLVRAIRYAIERQRAETALREYRDHLETMVESRSQELLEANDRLRREIEERTKAQEQMHVANMRLSKALAELKRTEEQIIRYERLHALGQMASGSMHDFNNLLMPVMGYSDMLLESPDMLDNRDATLDILRRIRDGAANASDAVRRLRHFHRPADGDEGRAPLDVNKAVERALALTQPKWKEEMSARGVAIHIRKEFESVPLILGREGQLTEALTNLILNALDAMPAGGSLLLRTTATADEVTVEVRDTGTGMPAHVVARCFEPFFTTKGSHATGLGLAMVHGIVREHGGDVEIESTEGSGTGVALRLPVTAIRATTPPAAADAEAGGPLRVLVIDDDPQVCRFLRAVFETGPYTAEVVDTARDGLRAFGEKHFDVVITDRAMPEMSGDEVAAEVKRQKPSVPVIMLTGFGDLLNDSAQQPPGVDRILSKPLRASELKHAVREVFSVKPA